MIYVINVWPYDRFGIGQRKGKIPDEYRLGSDKLERAKESMVILHPLPRLDELPVDIDGTRYAKYFDQATNGVYIRMALLALLLGRESALS